MAAAMQTCLSQRSCVSSSTFAAQSRQSAVTVPSARAQVVTYAAPKSALQIDVQPVQRSTAPPPEPLPVMHSAAFIQAKRKQPSASTTSQESDSMPYTSSIAKQKPSRQDGSSGEGIMWALKQVDRSLDELEQKPLPLQKEIYAFSQSPVGKSTGTALEAAAKLTVEAGKEAVKAAVPVAQWLGKEGAKAAISLAAMAMQQNAKKK